MMENHPPKTLQMLIKEQWLVESIKSLGSGYCTHLAYQLNDIEPEILTDLQNPGLGEVLGEIIKAGKKPEQAGHLVATVEVEKINHFPSFIRFDLRILEVLPFLRNSPARPIFRVISSKYLCYYYQ